VGVARSYFHAPKRTIGSQALWIFWIRIVCPPLCLICLTEYRAETSVRGTPNHLQRCGLRVIVLAEGLVVCGCTSLSCVASKCEHDFMYIGGRRPLLEANVLIVASKKHLSVTLEYEA